MSEINFEEDQQDLIEKTDIQTLASFCRDLQSYENEIAKLEELVKDKKQKADKISSEVIPNLLAEQGLSSLKLADGSSIDIRKSYNCTIKKDQMELAYNWLRETDWVTSLKMRLLYSSGKAKITRRSNCSTLQSKKVMSLLKNKR